MTVSKILEGLNKQQQAAVSAGEGPVLVLAGPGSGKTRVLTHRIAYLVEDMDVRAWHIMAVTFTNKAAREMEKRVVHLLGGTGKLDGLSIGTFHAICARILRVEAEFTTRTRDYLIFDTGDQQAVVKQALAELNIDPKRYDPRTMLNYISGAKNELIGPADYPASDYRAEIVRRVYIRYDELLKASNARDFDDLLVHAVQLFLEHPDVLARYQHRYHHILVDEFQDTNMAQYKLVRLLAGERRNLFAVGDPDQSIYAFRGADYRNVQRFRSDYPDTQMILLEQNYRSHQAILDAATGVINQNPGRVQKNLFSERKEGPLLHIKEAYSEDDEAQFVIETIVDLVKKNEFNLGDFAVMYRTNAQSRALEDAFLRAGLPYRLVGATRFYARREVKDALAYLRLIHNPDDNVSLARIINVPPRGIGQKTLEELEDWAKQERMTPSQALQLLAEVDEETLLSTRAQSKLLPFAKQIHNWRQQVDQLSPADMLTAVLNDSGYFAYLDNGTEEGRSRAENVMELFGVAQRYEGLSLTVFLEEVSLVSDLDEEMVYSEEDGDSGKKAVFSLREGRGDKELSGDKKTKQVKKKDAPSLLTLHSAKGLEFPVVFIVGLEEGIMPHSRSIFAENDPKAKAADREKARLAVEEERRLMYVGMTRAKERLFLVYAFRRSLYGTDQTNMPSRFLYDIPEAVRDGALLRKQGQATRDTDLYRRMTSWNRAATASRGPRPTAEHHEEPPRFKAGTCVLHKEFGEGVVVSSKGSGDWEKVMVLFPGGVGEKEIIADYLTPKN